jgi:hypothetical protein
MLFSQADLGSSAAILQLVTNLGSFGVIVWAIVIFLPRVARDMVSSYSALQETFKNEVEHVRDKADARAEKISQTMEQLIIQIRAMQQTQQELVELLRRGLDKHP